jgi:hypothetical protein
VGRDADLDQHLLGTDRGLQVVLEELRRRHRPAPAGACHHHLGVERHRHRRQVAGRVGVRDRAAERAAVADRRVGHGLRRLGEQTGVRLDQVGGHDLVVRRHRADDQGVAVLTDAAHLLDPTDVDEDGRVGEPQPQQGDQRLTAREDLAVLAGLGQRRDGLVDRRGPHVVELGGDHWAPPAVVSVWAPP